MSGNRSSRRVHPIVRQIVDRDCHVSLSNREVVRHVISKLKQGYETFRGMSRHDRKRLIEDCITQHRANWLLYARVMNGSAPRPLASRRAGASSPLSGPDVVQLMRRHRLTIRGLAFRLGTSQKRVRLVRARGLADRLAVRDWLEAMRGADPGPLPERYRIHRPIEEAECRFCGCPLLVGDAACEYVGEVFCSTDCCRKSRGWS